eukprot:COSAG01_NODE_11003_length_2029_cov_1.279275_2_plen_215_part_00
MLPSRGGVEDGCCCCIISPLVEGSSSDLARRFRPQFRGKNRRDIGKSQPIWTDSKMETARSHEDIIAVVVVGVEGATCDDTCTHAPHRPSSAHGPNASFSTVEGRSSRTHRQHQSRGLELIEAQIARVLPLLAVDLPPECAPQLAPSQHQQQRRDQEVPTLCNQRQSPPPPRGHIQPHPDTSAQQPATAPSHPAPAIVVVGQCAATQTGSSAPR